MTDGITQHSGRTEDRNLHPFRRAVLRGLAVLLPPLLTIVILVWVFSTIREYVLIPVETGALHVITWAIEDIHEAPPPLGPDGSTDYALVADGKYVPLKVYEQVRRRLGTEGMPRTARGIYHAYVDQTFLRWYYVIPLFLCGFLLLLSLLGKFMAAGAGRILWNFGERIIHRLPLIRNVYSSVKQVTDFLFSEREIQFNRVVAIEYPRKGIWSLGFVTSEGLFDIRCAANEPILTVLIPTSPMPATGFTVTIKKSEAIDLNITLDQALQFIVSCGVVVPTPSASAGPVLPMLAGKNGAHNGNPAEGKVSGGRDAELPPASSAN